MDRTAESFDERNLAYPGWRVTLAAAGGVFWGFASLLVYTFGVFLKPLTLEFGWSREAASAAFGIAALSVAACSPPLGLLLDRYPVRRILLPCLAVFGIAFASLSLLTGRLAQLYVCFLVLGIVGNGTAHLAYARALGTWFNERRGAAFALLLSGGAAGAIILPSAAQYLIGRFGWRSAFLYLGLSVLAIGLPLASRVYSRPGSLQSRQSVAEGGATVREGLRSRSFWILVVVLFCTSISQNAAIAHLPALLTDSGVPGLQAAMAVSTMGAALLIGRLVTGWLLDRYFGPYVAFWLLCAAAIGPLLLAGKASLTTGLVSAALIGFGMGGEGDITPYLLSRYFGLRSFSTLYGFTWTAYALAGALGPMLMGRVFDATGSYRALLLWLMVLTLASAVLVLWLPRYSSSKADVLVPTEPIPEV